MQRVLDPELLDELAPGDPAAQKSRRDLRRINWLMRHSGIAYGLLQRYRGGRLQRVADIGCGDGAGALTVLEKVGPVSSGADLFLIDTMPVLLPETIARLKALGWNPVVVQADVFDWLDASSGQFDLIMSNLFLHHFEDQDLLYLLTGICKLSGLFVATEPLRTQFSYVASRAVGMIGANSVTRHDAPASVCAGFHGRELGQVWPGKVLFEGRRWPFTHAFAARGLNEI